MPAIFLSYRRNDNAERVSRIYDWFIHHGVPKNEIYFDTSRQSNRAGTVFPENIKAAVASAECVLAIIGPQWLSYGSGLLRKPNLWRSGDWVRKEIEIALSGPAQTIPLLLDQTPMPAHSELPDSIQKLALLQAARLLRGESEFEDGMLVLAEQMASALAHSLRWDAQHRCFIAVQGERLAYLRALEVRYSVLNLPVAQDIQLPASAIYQPLQLRKDPARPADRPQDRDRHEKQGQRDRYEREQGEEGNKERRALDEQTRPTISRADSPEQALHLSPTRRLVVLGGPGSGKTTLLGQLILTATMRALQDPTMPLPILLSLPALARSGEWTVEKLPNFIASTLDGMNKSLPPHAQAPTTIASVLAQQIVQGSAFLCLDGLDEVIPALRRGVLSWLATLSASVNEAYIVVGSRFTDYRQGELPPGQYAEWELETLSAATRQTLVNALVPKLNEALHRDDAALHPIDAGQLLAQLGKGSAIGWWGDSPLLLTLAAFVYVKRRGALPPRRVEVYDEVITSLLEERLRRDGLYSDFTLRTTHDLLALVALDLFNNIGQVFTVGQITELTRAACAVLHVTGEGEMDRMYRRIVNSGLVEPQASETFKFRHPTFQEYLAGAGLAARLTSTDVTLRTEAWSLLDKKSIMSRWVEPLALMAGILVTKHGTLGEQVATDWMGKLADQRSTPNGDPGYLALAQAIHALRDTVGLISPRVIALQDRCINAWVEALIETTRQNQRRFTERLLALVSDIADINTPHGATS